MGSRSWVIVGYDSTKQVYERRLPEGSLSEAEVITMLQRLASRHLTDDEVVSASLRKNASAHRSDFEVLRNGGGRYALMTTGNPHYIASIDED